MKSRPESRSKPIRSRDTETNRDIKDMTSDDLWKLFTKYLEFQDFILNKTKDASNYRAMFFKDLFSMLKNILELMILEVPNNCTSICANNFQDFPRSTSWFTNVGTIDQCDNRLFVHICSSVISNLLTVSRQRRFKGYVDLWKRWGIWNNMSKSFIKRPHIVLGVNHRVEAMYLTRKLYVVKEE